MKKMFLAVLMVLVLVLSACAPAVQRVVDLPDTLEADIMAVVLFGASWVIVQLVTLVPLFKFLNDFKVPLSMAISAQLIGLIESSVPDAYGAVVILALQLILAVVALFMTAEKLKARGVKGFQ